MVAVTTTSKNQGGGSASNSVGCRTTASLYLVRLPFHQSWGVVYKANLQRARPRLFWSSTRQSGPTAAKPTGGGMIASMYLLIPYYNTGKQTRSASPGPKRTASLRVSPTRRDDPDNNLTRAPRVGGGVVCVLIGHACHTRQIVHIPDL